MSTNTAASADIAALNYITLHADGKSDVDVKITEINGKLVFDVSVVPGSNPNLSTLQALYFNIKGLDLNESSTLKIEGALVTRSGVTADRAGLDGDSSNVNGHGGPYDVFVEFGTRGVTSASFTLYDPASTQPVLLNLLGGQTFGFRLDTPDDKIITNAPLAPNHAPVAANDTRHTNEDTPLTVAVADLLANDTDLDGNALTMTGVSQGAKGTVKLTDGKITYTPDPNFNGTDSFTYTVSDGQGGQTTATVTVMVAAVNDEPTGFPSKILAHGQEDTTYIVHAADLVEGLSDPDGDTLLVFGLKADKAQVVNNGDGTFTLTPDANYSGPISLTYNVVEGKGSSKVAHQSITFDPVNDAPVAAPVILPEGKQGQTIIITAAQLLAKASDVDGDVLTVSSLALSSKEGTLVNNGNGTWAYTPDAHYSGPVSFSYVVSDGSERASSTASLVLTPVKTEPGTGGSTPAGTYDDLIEASDGDDIIHGGRGNDEMQGEGGNDIIVGGTDNGSLGWTAGTLTNVTIGDNLYGNDGNDTYFYSKGDGVDLIWDFRPDADTIVLGYGSTEIIGATFVTGVTNRIGTPSHDKIALILGSGDAIVINDFGGLRDSTREAFVFADGKKLSMKDVLALVEEKPVTTDLPTAWSSVPGAGRGISVRANSSLDLYGSNDGETLIGRGGDDRLYGNEGFNQLNGNDGRDELYGGNVSDVIVGGNDDDLGYGQSGDDTIVGGAGSDKLYGGGGRDIIYGDTDGSGDGSNISNQGFDFKFGLELESKYRDLFQSAEPVDGIKVTPSALVITPGKNWWGGFEVTLTVKADASLAGWSLFLNSAYEITSIWGAELSKVQDASTSDVYELKNAPWNGSLAKGQTTTIGFTVRTPFDLVVDDHELLLTGLKIGQTAALDMGVAGAVSVMNAKLSAMNEVTVAESYTLTGSNQKAVAISGNKAIDLVGNKLSNVIIGNDGANEITGGGGKDTLTGKGGKDTFIFDTKASKSNVDKVTDFNVNDDYFQLDNAVFKKLGKGTELKPGKLNKDFFTIGTKAKDQNDYIIYNKAKGVLLYDADGSGSGKAVEFATLSKNLKMTSSDLLVI